MILSKQIYSLLTVAQCGSFLKAADQLYVSASALVQQINLLEQEVGAQLLERSHRGVSLTPAGEAFCEKMRAVVEAVEEAKRLAVQTAGVPDASIAIAYAQNLQHEYVYGVYRQYVQRGGAMRLTSLPYEQVLRGVLEGEYDGCYIQSGNRLRKSGLKTVLLWSATPTLAVSRDHPLAGRAAVGMKDLEGMEIVLPEYGLHDSADTFRDEVLLSGVQVQIVSITDLMHSEIYCREHGAARLCLRRVLDPEMVTVPIETRARFGICLAYRRDPRAARKLDALICLTRELHARAAPNSTVG